MTRARLKRKMERDLLADAYKRIQQAVCVFLVPDRHGESFLKLDPRVAKAAFKAFRNAEGAAFWMTRGSDGLAGRVPIDVAKSSAGVYEVISLLRKFEAGGSR